MTSNTNSIGRRKVLKLSGAALSASLLAGCSSSADTNEEGSNTGDGSTVRSSPESGENSADSGSTDFGGWFNDVDNFDGVDDMTSQSEITVEVGTQGNGGNFAFEPAAARISSGTTVVWEWTGEGGSHDVAAEAGAGFNSQLTESAGHTFEHTFEETGLVTYFCTPHRSLGMKGAIVIE